MINFLVRKFVKEPENVDSPKTRESYGTLSSFVGIACNVTLFVVKYAMGIMSNSIAVISDAFNNLSDSASCIITLFGYKMAAKPADKDHPFGHGRIEYLTSLIISAIIVIMGFELFRDSAAKIFHPEDVKFSWIVLASLVLSIALKFWMSHFNNILGHKINSTVMIATAKDSKNDVIATSATVVAVIASLFTKLPVDGIMGVIVSAFILKAGYGIIKDTVDDLIGKPADEELVAKIQEIIMSDERIIGIHDLLIHSYGPGSLIGSCHVEVRCNDDFVMLHDAVDVAEHRINHELGVLMTIHMDPVDVDDQKVNECRSMVRSIIKNISEDLSIHDFRLVSGETHTNLIFDLVVPYDIKFTDQQLKEIIDDKLSFQPVNYYTVITFDKQYTSSDK